MSVNSVNKMIINQNKGNNYVMSVIIYGMFLYTLWIQTINVKPECWSTDPTLIEYATNPKQFYYFKNLI